MTNAINSRKTYEAWSATLSTQESSLLAKVEKTIAIQLGMSAPKGLREWREFVTAVVAAYEVANTARLAKQGQGVYPPVAIMDSVRETLVAPAVLKGAAKRHADYLASIVIASNCAICGPRDKAGCGVCYPADANGYALITPGKTFDELADEMLSVEEMEAGRAHALPADPEITAAIDRAYQTQRDQARGEDVFTRTERARREYAERQAPDAVDAYAQRHHVDAEPIREALAEVHADAMSIILDTVTADSGNIHGGVTSGELFAAGASRRALTRAVNAGWVIMLPVLPGQAESDRAPRYYLSEAGRVERDRRRAPLSQVSAPGEVPQFAERVPVSQRMEDAFKRIDGNRAEVLDHQQWMHEASEAFYGVSLSPMEPGCEPPHRTVALWCYCDNNTEECARCNGHVKLPLSGAPLRLRSKHKPSRRSSRRNKRR